MIMRIFTCPIRSLSCPTPTTHWRGQALEYKDSLNRCEPWALPICRLILFPGIIRTSGWRKGEKGCYPVLVTQRSREGKHPLYHRLLWDCRYCDLRDMASGKGALRVCGVGEHLELGVCWSCCPETAWFGDVPLLQFSIIKISMYTQN